MKNSTHKQKHTAELLDHHVDFTEASELLQFCNTYFFYLCIDYKHKHAQDQAACHVVHAKIYFFYLYIDYKHRRAPRKKPGPVHFFIDSP